MSYFKDKLVPTALRSKKSKLELKQDKDKDKKDEKDSQISDVIGDAVAVVATPALGPFAPVVGEIVDTVAGLAINEIKDGIEEGRKQKDAEAAKPAPSEPAKPVEEAPQDDRPPEIAKPSNEQTPPGNAAIKALKPNFERQDKAVQTEPLIGDASVCVPVRVAKHNTQMEIKRQSTLPQQPPKDTPKGKGNENKEPPVPPALANALRHMEIVAARSKPPGAGKMGPTGFSRHMRMAAGEPPQEGVAKGKGDDKDEAPPRKDDLPPNLAKALRSMQIVAARTPEGRALAAAAMGDKASPTPTPGPQAKIKAVAGDKGVEGGNDKDDVMDGDKKDVDEPIDDPDKDLPPELKASKRHMAIFAASQKSGGPAPAAFGALQPPSKTSGPSSAKTPEPGQAPSPIDQARNKAAVTGAIGNMNAENNLDQVQLSEDKLTDEDQPGEETPDDDKSATSESTARTEDALSNKAEAQKPQSPTDVTNAPIEPSESNADPQTMADGLESAAKPASTDPSAMASASTKGVPGDEPTQDAAADSKEPINPIVKDIVRYRYSYGTNLGSIYVLEKWLTASAFPPDASEDETSELDCVSLWVEDIGPEATQKKFEERWSRALTDEDWKFLTEEAHCNAIRLPIGYFTLGSEFCKGTPFEELATVYKNAWASAKTFIEAAWKRGIGCLVDLHASPGGATPGEHSGTNVRAANLWGNQANLGLATKCLEFIAKETKDLSGVIGIQLCNEARWDAPGMYEWYEKTAAAIAAIDPGVPLYISDAWNLAKATDWVKQQNKSGDKRNPLVADTHIYYCFTDEHKGMSPAQINEHVSSKCLAELNDKTGKVLDTGASAAIVGEWSCTLSQESLAKAEGDKSAAKKAFGNKQCERYEAKAGGSYFWTLKLDWMDGGDWGFVAQTKSQGIKAPKWLLFEKEEVEGRTQNADSKAKGLKEKAVKEHVDYWSTHEHKAGDVEPGLEDSNPASGDKADAVKADAEPGDTPAEKANGPKETPKEASQEPRFAPPKHSKTSSVQEVKQKLKKKAAVKPVASPPAAEKPASATTPNADKDKGELYRKGWELGWNDARIFFRCRNEGDVPNEGADCIGLKDLWVLKCINESEIKADNLWEFEHGIWKGIADFEDVALD